jgi:hypothetical protein
MPINDSDSRFLEENPPEFLAESGAEARESRLEKDEVKKIRLMTRIYFSQRT